MVCPKEHERRNLELAKPPISFAKKLFLLCSFMCICTPESDLASTRPSVCIQGRNYGSLTPSKLQFGLAVDYVLMNEISYLDCHWTSRIYEPKPILIRKMHAKSQVDLCNIAKLLRGLVLTCLFAFWFVIFNVLVLFTFMTARLSVGGILQEQLSFKNNLIFSSLLLFTVQMFVFRELTSSSMVVKRKHVSKLLVLAHSGQKKKHNVLSKRSRTNYHGVNRSSLIAMLLLLSGDVELNPGPLDGKIKSDQVSTAKSGSDLDHQSGPLDAPNAQPNNPSHIEQSTSEQDSQPKVRFQTEAQQVSVKDIGDANPTSIEESNKGCRKSNAKARQPDKLLEGKELFIRKQKNELAKNKAWKDGVGFTDLTRTEVHDILVAANQLFSSRKDCFLCIRCGRTKPDSIKCHIFPKPILEIFRKVHCGGTENFIHDFSMQVRKSRQYVYPLNCKYCEDFVGKYEGHFKSVYLLVLAHNENTISLHNENSWFRFVLANIMLRGIIVSESLAGLLTEYKERFVELWNSALEKGNKIFDMRLFVLPNCPISHNNTHFLFALEQLIRNPSIAKLCESEAAGIFLYTHFDCFHVVSPLNEKSRNYFDSFESVCLDDDPVVLVRCTYPDVKIIADVTGRQRFDYIGNKRIYFPAELLNVNATLYLKHAAKLSIEERSSGNVHVPEKETPRIYTTHFPNEEPDYNPPRQEPHHMHSLPNTADTHILYTFKRSEGSEEALVVKTFTRKDVDSPSTNSTLIEIAAGYSPLTKPYKTEARCAKLEADIEETKKVITESESEKKLMNNKLFHLNRQLQFNQHSDETSVLKLEINILRQQNEKQKRIIRKLRLNIKGLKDDLSKLTPLVTKVARLEKKVEKLTLEKSALQEKFFHEQVLAKQLRRENMELKTLIAQNEQ